MKLTNCQTKWSTNNFFTFYGKIAFWPISYIAKRSVAKMLMANMFMAKVLKAKPSATAAEGAARGRWERKHSAGTCQGKRLIANE